MAEKRYTHLRPAIRTKLTPAGAAGNRSVLGIAVDDDLLQVEYIKFTLAEGTPNTITWLESEDVTSEFSITAADTINNTGGTSFTGGALLVTFHDVSLKAVGE